MLIISIIISQIALQQNILSGLIVLFVRTKVILSKKDRNFIKVLRS